MLKKKRKDEEAKARRANTSKGNATRNKKFDKTKRVAKKTPTVTKKKKKKERHPDGRHAKRSKARLEQIQ